MCRDVDAQEECVGAILGLRSSMYSRKQLQISCISILHVEIVYLLT